MDIKKVGVPSIMADNDMQFISYLVRIVEKLDANAKLVIIGRMQGYRFLVHPTCDPQDILREIKEMNHLLGVNATYYTSPSAPIDFIIG